MQAHASTESLPADLLTRSLWAAQLPRTEQQRVAEQSTARLFSAGSTMASKGEPVEAWIGVIDGLVKVASVSAEGKAVTFTSVPSGSWFGEGSLC